MDYYITPSNSHLWTHCPYSAEPYIIKSNCSGESRKSTEISEQSRRGTAAHTLARAKILREFSEYSQEKYILLLDNLANNFNKYEFNKMNLETDKYIECINSIIEEKGENPKKAVEYKIDCSNLYNTPSPYGYIDFLMIFKKELYILDFKYGDGIEVDVNENTQLLIYSAAFLYNMKEISKTIETVTLCIFQDEKLKQKSLSREEVITWVNDVLKPAADAVYSNHSKTCKGTWCSKFCPKRAKCKAFMQDINNIYKDSTELTEQEILETFLKMQELKSTIKLVEEYLLELIENGKKIDGIVSVHKHQKKITDPINALIDMLSLAREKGINITNIVNLKSRADLREVFTDEEINDVLDKYIEDVQCKGTLKPSYNAAGS